MSVLDSIWKRIEEDKSGGYPKQSSEAVTLGRKVYCQTRNSTPVPIILAMLY